MRPFNTPIVEFHSVSKGYPEHPNALQDITFSLRFGEMIFLTGHSGAGKSTIFKLITGIETPTRGEIIVADQSVASLSRRGLASLRQAVGIVVQDSALIEEFTLFANVALPLHLSGLPKTDIAAKVKDALNVVGLFDMEKRYPRSLSQGERQRVGIARAIVMRPPLLLADEPTGNVDPELGAEIMKLFVKLNKSGMSVLVATHDLALIAPLRCPILTLKKGALVSC